MPKPNSNAPPFPSDIAFTDAVKAVQTRKGSRGAYARMETSGGWETEVTDALAEFIHEQTSFFLASANGEGQPYVQHRGGPKGFLRVVDAHTLGFADFSGNRQYITLGNLAENPKVQLFLVDYATRQRIKIWGEAKVVEDDAELLASLKPEGYVARAERAIIIDVKTWDANCPQHIPLKIDAADVEHLIAEKDRRIAELEKEVARLKNAPK